MKHEMKTDKLGALALIAAGISAACFAAFWVLFILLPEIALSPVLLLGVSVFTLFSVILYLLVRKKIPRWKANLLAVGVALGAIIIVTVIVVFVRAIFAF